MYVIDLSGMNGVVLGVANQRSIAWYISQALSQSGARLAITYQNERFRNQVESLAATLPNAVTTECDVSDDAHIERTFRYLGDKLGTINFVVHSIAYANREDLGGAFSATSREGFRIALETSAYSLMAVSRLATPFMANGGSILTMTFQASERVFPGYNIMGTAKAALENEVMQLAAELGEKNIRVNAISAGPLETLAARGIKGFSGMKHMMEERTPLRRNITHEEVAKTALFLCSDLSSGITGAIIPVDAGFRIMAV